MCIRDRSYIVKSTCDSDVFTLLTYNIVSDQDIALETRKTRSAKASKFFHLSPKSKKNAEKWDLKTAFATKLKLEDPTTETFELGGTESPSNTETLEYIEQNLYQTAKEAPIFSPQKLAKEIEKFLIERQAPTQTVLTTGTTAPGGEFAAWTLPPEYKSSHIAVTESLMSVDSDIETETETDEIAEPAFTKSDADTVDLGTTALGLALARNGSPYQFSRRFCISSSGGGRYS